jgi:hypothetical protein
MAVYCGVCAHRIWSAPENGGRFPTDDFGGWDEGSRIDNTCEDCAAALRAVVSHRAAALREDNLDRVEGLRLRLAEEDKRRREHEEARRKALAEVDARFHR